jgi:hypothetical protein
MYDGREIETAARNYGEKQLSMLQAKAQSAGVRATTLVVGASCPVLTVRGR